MQGGSRCLVTGASGLLGSHLVERLVAAGGGSGPWCDPRVMCGSSKPAVSSWSGGISPTSSRCRRAVRGVEVVYHAAAKVGDWGPWKRVPGRLHRRHEDPGPRRRSRRGSGRFLHISSTSAYGHPPDQPEAIDDITLLAMGQCVWIWDPYTRSKVACETLLWQLARIRGLPLTVLRPSWLYGERDRTTVARLVSRLRAGSVPLIGRGDNPLSAIYAGNVADAALLAARDPGSAGEAYNISNQGRITQARVPQPLRRGRRRAPRGPTRPLRAGLRRRPSSWRRTAA